MSRWPTAPLGELCRVTSGGTPARAVSSYYGGSIPWVKIGDMLQGEVSETEETITQSGLENSAAKLLPAGTVLISIFATIGRTAILGVDAATNQAIAGLTPYDLEKLLPMYLRRYLDSAVEQLTSQARGVAQVNINSKILKEIEVPLPPLNAQRSALEILDRADELREKRRQAITLLNHLTQSIFLNMFGDPVANPQGWQCAPLTEVCRTYSGGTPSKAVAENWVGDLPWFSAKDLKHDDLWDSQDHINDDVPKQTSLRLLAADTVVIVVRGMILRHTFPVSVLRVPATINQDLKALMPRIDLAPQFLAHCLRAQSIHTLQQVSTAAHGTARLDTQGMSKIQILLPPRHLQDQFVARVGDLERLLAAQRKSMNELNGFFTSLQERAFRNEL